MVDYFFLSNFDIGNNKEKVMTRKDIIDAYCEIRKTNTNIPDDVLDFMKDAAIEKHKIMERQFPQLFKAFVNEPIEKKGLDKFFSDLERYENDLYCDECGEEDKTNFVYQRTCASGEVWHCKTCNQEHVKGVKPNEDNY